MPNNNYMQFEIQVKVRNRPKSFRIEMMAHKIYNYIPLHMPPLIGDSFLQKF